MDNLKHDSLIQITTQNTKGYWNGFSESLGYVYQPTNNTRFTMAVASDWSKRKSLLKGQKVESLVMPLQTKTSFQTLSDDWSKQPSKSVGLSYWHQFDTTEQYIESNLYFLLSENQGSFNYTEDYHIFNTLAIDSTYSHSIQSQMKNCQEIYYDLTYYKPISSSMRWNLNYILEAKLNKHNIMQANSNKILLPLLAKDDKSDIVY